MKRVTVTLIVAIVSTVLLVSGCVSNPIKGSNAKYTTVIMPDNASPAYQARMMKCVNDANVRLADAGQPGIEVIPEKEAKEKQLKTVGLAAGAVIAAPIILPATLVSGALLGGIGTLYNKQSADRERRISAETFITECMHAAERAGGASARR
jgi:outer membrane murein-binding lipoprotein Lpp